MIKALIRLSVTLGIAGTTFFTYGVLEQLAVSALPEEEVLNKLDSVLVFTIVDEQGAPLVASGEDEAKIAGVFISQEDANQFYDHLKTKNSELVAKIKVVSVSLSEVYKLSKSEQTKTNPLKFAYVPQEEAVTSAKIIGEANQKPYQGGVPLFVARGGADKSYLTIEKDSKQVIPFFFDKQQLEQMVDRFKEQKPDIAESLDIEVVPLEGVLETLETSEDEMLEKIILVPTEESTKFSQSLSNPLTGDAASQRRIEVEEEFYRGQAQEDYLREQQLQQRNREYYNQQYHQQQTIQQDAIQQEIIRQQY